MTRKVLSIQVRMPIEFLSRLIAHIEGDAIMSMEGDLSRCSFDEIEGYQTEAVGPLKKITLWSTGRHDFAIMPISQTNRSKIIESILPRIGVKSHVWHIEIAQNGIKLFGAYDSFDPECVVLDHRMGEGILETMRNEGIIHSYKLIEADF
jgi:hypothetical protein